MLQRDEHNPIRRSHSDAGSIGHESAFKTNRSKPLLSKFKKFTEVERTIQLNKNCSVTNRQTSATWYCGIAQGGPMTVAVSDLKLAESLHWLMSEGVGCCAELSSPEGNEITYFY